MRFDRLATGRLVLPGGILAGGWTGIRGGRIAAIGSGFDGMAFPVRVAATHLRGVKAHADGAVLAPAGSGRFVPRIHERED